jgi:hypothetical protein
VRGKGCKMWERGGAMAGSKRRGESVPSCSAHSVLAQWTAGHLFYHTHTKATQQPRPFTSGLRNGVHGSKEEGSTTVDCTQGSAISPICKNVQVVQHPAGVLAGMMGMLNRLCNSGSLHS